MIVVGHLSLLAFLGFSFSRTVAAFHVDTYNTAKRVPSLRFLASFDYEYIPPNPDALADDNDNTIQYTSAYPKGTPAGLRGEAVRSALRSGRCIGWELGSDPSLSPGGILQIKGAGTRDFLNNKFTQEFTVGTGSSPTFQEACLLDAKGRVYDRLMISLVDEERAMIMTSPGHSSKDLLNQLDQFVFPLDRIELSNVETFTFSLASTQWKDIENVMQQVYEIQKNTAAFPFPRRADQCQIWQWDDSTQVLVNPSLGGMPIQACVGFTFVFFGEGGPPIIAGKQVWNFLTGEANREGPIGIGAAEYESLRIQSGVPAFGKEIGKTSKTSPLELHMQHTINMDKGCYLGQEGVASIWKNPRGPPRTLYSVVFDDDMNTYESQSRGDKSKVDNLTRMPRPGDTLYALGSSEELNIGALTSVAEASSTGDRNIVGLALIRRADSILKRMKELDIEISPEPTFDDFETEDSSSCESEDGGIILPPPLDPLDGLEVIIGGTFTTGRLKMVPSRAYRKTQNMFLLEERVEVADYFEETSTTASSTTTMSAGTDKKSLADEEADAKKAAEEAEAAAVNARRKAEKMEMLKKRAEEAMARRKKQQNKS